MPAKRDYTPEGALAELERRRRLKSDRQQRWRLQKKAVASTDVASTYRRNGAVASTPRPPHTPPAPVVPTEQRLLERLAPFASRAFKPDPAFLALLAERYPAVDLELELAAALDWLEEPRHAKRRCSKGFLANWVKKADADRMAREQAPPPPSRRELVLGQPYVQPQSQQRNTRPDYVKAFDHDLVPTRPDELHRFQAEARRLPFDQRLAQAQARGGPK